MGVRNRGHIPPSLAPAHTFPRGLSVRFRTPWPPLLRGGCQKSLIFDWGSSVGCAFFTPPRAHTFPRGEGAPEGGGRGMRAVILTLPRQ